MLVYIIDGFNLIHKVSFLRKSSCPHSDLIHYIKNKKLTGSKNNKVIIVFDGGYNSQAKSISQGFEVVFSQQISADEVIKNRLAKIKNKRQVVVVSDDREIRDNAKAQRAISCRIDDFIKVKREKQIRENQSSEKDISYTLQHEITEELRKIWLKDGE